MKFIHTVCYQYSVLFLWLACH